MGPIGDTVDRRSFGRRFVRGLFSGTTLVSIGLCLALVLLFDDGHWRLEGLVVFGIWLFIGFCEALAKSAWGRRSVAKRVAEERAWAAAGKRPWWAKSFRATLIFMLLCSVGFFAIAVNAGRDAKALARVPACTAGGPSDCVGSRQGVLVSRSTDSSQQSITVDFGVAAKTIHLSSDGWGGKWRGHFPLGETVTVRLHGQTPLLVTEPDGHHRKTADDPTDTSTFFWLIGWVFAGMALPSAYLLQSVDRRRSARLLARTSAV